MDTSKPCVVDLESISSDNQEFRLTLDSLYFERLDADEIRKGELEVILTVRRVSLYYELDFDISGTVCIECDRCLDEMEQEIETQGALKVMLGAEYSDDGEQITVPADDGTIDVSWNIYEFVMLAIPIRHTHEEGECNPEMLQALNRYDSEQNKVEQQEKPIDARWEKLKEILNN